MLRYSIFTLVIILIVTIVLSYSYNEEAFTDITATSAMSGAGATGAGAGATGATGAGTGTGATGAGTGTGTGAGAARGVGTGTGAGAGTGVGAGEIAAAVAAATAAGTILDTELATAAPTKRQIPRSDHSIGTVNTKLPSQSFKETNTHNVISKKDKMIVRREFSGSHLRVFASMPSLSDNEQLTFWIISGNNGNSSSRLIWKPVFVTNDSTFLSAEVPEENYRDYIGKTVYLVSRTGQSSDDADGTFIVPDPDPNPKPAVVNPEVTLSDTGYDAMKLNKQSNMLNDIQKIVHNEMLLHRATDVSVKNPASKKKKANNNASCVQNKMEIQNEMGTQDMSKYIKKDEIPCWGCSLDY
jgi:hypothetical protein